MIIFLAEEPSMHETLRGLLPLLFPHWEENVDWRCLPHEGKSDLEKSIPRKLRAWRNPGDRFVVLRDQDSADCRKVKERLQTLCRQSGREDTLIRIPCRELEAWFLGDLAAVEVALGVEGLARKQMLPRYRAPDAIRKPSVNLARLTGRKDKVTRAREIAPHLHPDANRSRSFQVFVAGLRRFVCE